ncbi:hypothetical protein [Pimelobacter sp. 30-1]|uniref:hypothetical protein n=1 Tax=Pimelobacter sp. 30-1 TaxID=2004991 RepID=UPI001C051D6A|nr:hypothetical protein [Pimelobacter sp. 30-1]MBU2698089.1 hypothetical protein [Pimelobacter sp. 30-1]
MALEHALAAQWALLTQGGPEQLVKHMQAGYLLRTKAFAGALEDDPALTLHVPEEDLRTLHEVAGQVPAPGKEREWSMERVFDRFSGTPLFYDLYRELSGAVHPSYSTIQAHLNMNDGGDRLHQRGQKLLAHSSARATALASALAMDFIERCQAVPPTPSPIAGVAGAAGLPHDLAFSDQAPDLQPFKGEAPA